MWLMVLLAVGVVLALGGVFVGIAACAGWISCSGGKQGHSSNTGQQHGGRRAIRSTCEFVPSLCSFVYTQFLGGVVVPSLSSPINIGDRLDHLPLKLESCLDHDRPPLRTGVSECYPPPDPTVPPGAGTAPSTRGASLSRREVHERCEFVPSLCSLQCKLHNDGPNSHLSWLSLSRRCPVCSGRSLSSVVLT